MIPSKSPAQHRLMEAAAHNPKVAMKVGVPQDTAREFVAADSARVAHHLATHAAGKRR